MVVYLLLGLVSIFGVWLALNWYVRAEPRQIIKVTAWGLALLFITIVLVLILSGRIGWALASLPVAFLWARRFFSAIGWGRRAHRWYKQSEEGPTEQQARNSTAMSKEEACDILGVGPNASAEEIKAAYNRLIKNMHPDQGGSDYLASKINQARDILLDD